MSNSEINLDVKEARIMVVGGGWGGVVKETIATIAAQCDL